MVLSHCTAKFGAKICMDLNYFWDLFNNLNWNRLS